MSAARSPLGVKICGITRPEDALLAAELGARFVGLNFYPGSPRYLAVERAQRVADAVRGRVELVGVFVDAACDTILAATEAVGLDLIQLHGAEEDALIAELSRPVIKAVRTAPASFDPAAFPHAWAFLFDTPHAVLNGGTGAAWEYGALAGHRPARPTFIAGGIRPATARRALAESAADGLDVCSGVESAPGIKDPALIAELMTEVLHVG